MRVRSFYILRGLLGLTFQTIHLLLQPLHLIEQILDAGLEPVEPPPPLPPILPEDIELLCWMGIESNGERPAPEVEALGQ